MDNKDKYNIRIANLSIGTSNTSTNDLLVKAVQNMWDMGIVVTIGASDDNITANVWGSNLINFSVRGQTLECVVKSDVLAPGLNIVSCLSNNILKKSSETVEQNYFSLSGTSMSTPIVSGVIALLLEKYNDLEPDDIKLMLKKCCKKYDKLYDELEALEKEIGIVIIKTINIHTIYEYLWFL